MPSSRTTTQSSSADPCGVPHFGDDHDVYAEDDVGHRPQRQHSGRFDSLCAHHRSWRLAGSVYLLVALTGIFTLAYVPSRIPLSGDPATTLDTIRAAEPLFRIGIAAFLLMRTNFLLLRPAGPAADAAAGRRCPGTASATRPFTPA